MADEKEQDKQKVTHAVHIGIIITDIRSQVESLEDWDPERLEEVEEEGLKAARFALGQVLDRLTSY